jgi:hypothetical protein
MVQSLTLLHGHHAAISGTRQSQSLVLLTLANLSPRNSSPVHIPTYLVLIRRQEGSGLGEDY